MVEDCDPITEMVMDHGCMSCGSKTDKFYFVQYYVLPSKLVRKKHREKERFAFYCCPCYEADEELHITIDGKLLTIAKNSTPDVNNMQCAMCGGEIPYKMVYGIIASLQLMRGSGIESKPLGFLCSDCVENHTLEF